MPASDIYKTIKVVSHGLYKERGSKFISLAFPVTCESDIRQHLADTRKEHHDAKHHCYAYVLGSDGSMWRANDDGEPSGTGGKPILGQIRSFDLTNILVVIPRYFGGTLLGTSGLINAYRSAAHSALSNAAIIEKIVQQKCMVRFPYAVMNNIMKIIKEEEILLTDHSYDLTCQITILFRLTKAEKIIAKLSLNEGVEIDLLEVV
jgi:uncharacterized YigZ family protein